MSEDLDRLLDEAWGHLEAGEPERALVLARKLERADPEGPDAAYLAGSAELELDRPDRALARFEEACRRDPEWGEAAAGAAWSLFRLCRIPDCEAAVGHALRLDPALADMHYLQGVLAERRGDADSARAAFGVARRLDGERYPEWPVLTPAEFQSRIEAALRRLPRRFRDALVNMAIVLDPFPAHELLTGDSPPHDPELLGLFVGVPLTERSSAFSGDLPAVIHLFQRNLERQSRTLDELELEIAITLYHEIAHALGFEEEDMPDLGLE